jgi:DNA recombination protein RmuC
MNFLIIAVVLVNVAITALLLLRKSAPGPGIGAAQGGVDGAQLADEFKRQRSELGETLDRNSKSVEERLTKFNESLDGNARLSRQDAANGRLELEQVLVNMRESLQKEMVEMRKENEIKLEQMRATVDEKLHETLEKRLGESFKSVSERLEQVHKGLGEMQSLATGVGDLKRVLTNVKSRGGWGEVQLARQLADILTPDQYEANVNIKVGSRELVEFAIKLPGRIEGEICYLPIDAKFPQEDYDRLVQAQEKGSLEEMEAAGKELEKAIKLQAKTISEKYIEPPRSTDFGIMYLPTEGLYAEVIRRPGLASQLQNEFRVMVTGPTMLMALLNSLQMGFKTLAIEKSASDIWKTLSEVQGEFVKYGRVWEKLGKQLEAAQNTVADVGVRTRKLERKLDKAGSKEIAASSPLLGIADLLDDEDEDAAE